MDDDDSIRDALEDLFLSVGLQARSYATAIAFLDQADPLASGCLLSDVRLPQLGGLELQERLASHGFLLPVVFMSGFADIPMAVRGLKAGARDFLLKPLRDQDVLDAVNAAIELDRHSRLVAIEGGKARLRFASLTTREKQVASLILSGRKNRQVADDIGLSEITVKIHRSNAMRKLGAHNVQDLVRMDRLLCFAISDTVVTAVAPDA
ncbi:FixJ family two-component response regulator [Novosphingobium chloroacetimidivorans]|uniref:FixJ family two-component response regulator n=1 Tax=Novosphingobium chloroacetimidivorans TaxID=1428314 RepID=A0A7W7KBM4_9SPHN|nr:response regulator [Novosphingobium chloroacetimidivorans]MBB4859299.1 FixJ family two-component response regulator [Novosphingobium chloroacetimidivorans]